MEKLFLMKRLTLTGMLIVMIACAILAATIIPANRAHAATSCYGGAVKVTEKYATIDTNSYVTTSRCHDINVRFTDLYFNADVCVIFYKHTNECNYITTIRAGDTAWHVIATDVKDGTGYWLYFLPYPDYGHDVHGYLAS